MAILDAVFADKQGQTPQDVERRRKMAQALIAQSQENERITSPWQGVAKIAQSLIGGYEEAAADKQDQTNRTTASKALLDALYGPTASSPQSSSSIPMTGAAKEISATAPNGGSSYRDAIASIESAGSGGYSAVGPTDPKMGRALGRYQIMEANLAPWSQEALGRTVTPEEFLSNPQIQDAIFDKKFGTYVAQYGPEGASQAWFAGPGGVGKLDRKDSLGTSVADYTRKFTNAMGGQQVASLDPSAGMPARPPTQGPTQPAPALPPPTTVAAATPVAAQPAANTQVAQALTAPSAPSAPAGYSRETIARLLSNPYTAEAGQMLLMQETKRQQDMQQAQYEEQLKQLDPKYRQDLEKGSIEIEKLRNPQEPDSVRALRARASAAGLKEGTPEFNQFMITQGVKPPANVGTPPAGYAINYDQAGNPVSMSPIPGGPADTSKKDAAVSDSKETFTDVITNAASLARKAMADADLPTTGMVGRIAGSVMPGSSAAEVRRQVGVLKSNATIENLNAMRQQSPTGGALGNVTEGEGAMLSAKAGALDPDSPTFARDLDDYERTLLRIVHGKDQGDKIFDATRPAESKSAAPDPVADMPAPEGMDPAIWKFVPPEDRKLWLKK